MTEPTEWVMVARDQLSRWATGLEFRGGKAKPVWKEIRALLAGPTPPSSPPMEVVREWESLTKGRPSVANKYVDHVYDTGDRMAAALTQAKSDLDLAIVRYDAALAAQAKTIEGLERDKTALNAHHMGVRQLHAEANATLESTLTSLRAEVERLTAIIDREAIAHLERLLAVSVERDTARAVAIEECWNLVWHWEGTRADLVLALRALPSPPITKSTAKEGEPT